MEFWSPLREKVPTWAYTVEGSWNQIFLVRRALKASLEYPSLADAARGLLCWAWQERPLEGEFVALLLEQDSKNRLVSGKCRQLLEGLQFYLRKPQEISQVIEERAQGNNPEEAMDMAAERLGRKEESLHWLSRLWEWTIRHAAWTRWPQWLEAAALPDELKGMTQLRLRLDIQARIMAGDLFEAVDLSQHLDQDIFGLWRSYLQAEGLARAGDIGSARTALLELQRLLPWHTNLTLKLHDLIESKSLNRVEPSEDVAVCLYTWNKAELLETTLDDLAGSRLGRARVFALDNGSTDDTPGILEQSRQRIGPDRFKIITLPVNVGAPPARNWLLSLPEVKDCKWVAFLDDDVRLPDDWLIKLLAAAEDYPEAGAVGCRVSYVDPPHALQMVDVNLLPGMERDRLPLLSNALGEPDMGLQCYTRRVLSVTGCCHLLSRKGLDTVGGFDVRYNPSQLDDLERDLRLVLKQQPAVYVGQLAVAHYRKSGPGTAMIGRAGANALGNRLKLETAFDNAQAQELLRLNQIWVWEDLLEKAQRVEEFFRG